MARVVPASVVLLLCAGVIATAPVASAARSTGATPSTRDDAHAAAATTAARFHAARTFSLALGARLSARNIGRLSTRDLVIVDGESATASQVRGLKRRGAVVLAYLSVGSVENWRSWFSRLEPYRLEPLGDWDGERYADTSRSELRDALVDDIAPSLLAKPFDGLFLDNVDMVEEHAPQADGMFELVGRLSKLVHAGGGVLMTQNGDSIVERYLPLIDGWNREDPTGTYDFDRKRYVPTDAGGRRIARQTLRKVRAAGKLTTTTDYFASDASPAAKRAIRIACAAGAVPSVADIALTRVSPRGVSCAGKAAR